MKRNQLAMSDATTLARKAVQSSVYASQRLRAAVVFDGVVVRFAPALIRWSVHLDRRLERLPRTVDDRGRCFLGPIHAHHGDELRPSVLPTLSRTPKKSVPMARGNGARIMNIFAEGGQFIYLQTHFFGPL